MILPSYVTFYKNNIKVCSEFINVGWFISGDRLLQEIIKATHSKKLNLSEWDIASAYDMKIPQSDLILFTEKSVESKRFFENKYGYPW